MKAMKYVVIILSVCIVMPIWYYILYQILKATNATQLEWFLYWICLPVGLLVSTLEKIILNKQEGRL